MPRPAKDASIQSIIEGCVADVVSRSAESIGRAVAQMFAEELKRHLAAPAGGRRAYRRRSTAARPRRGEEITKWVADNRARRVPKFVIRLTGLETKKKIVAKFGKNAAFEKGKPLPKLAKAA